MLVVGIDAKEAPEKSLVTSMRNDNNSGEKAERYRLDLRSGITTESEQVN